MGHWPPTLAGVPWSAADWTYVAEGAANVIVRYTGQPVWPYVNTTPGPEHGAVLALRLPKMRFDVSSTNGYPPLDAYIDKVLSQLIPKEALPTLQCITFTPGTSALTPFLEQLAANIEPFRPEARREAGTIDTAPSFIWAMRDWSYAPPRDGVPQLLVEIKPKAGIVCNGPTNDENKRKHTKYRMHRIQRAAPHQGAVPPVTPHEFASWYDPLDFFSADRARISKAVHALCIDWASAPKNNFSVMCNGRKLDFEADKRLLCASLHSTEKDLLETLALAVTDSLCSPQNQSILSNIVAQQARLDGPGIEELARRWEALTGASLQDGPEDCSRTVLPLSPPPLQDYVNAVRKNPAMHIATLDELYTTVILYMIGATIKDASIFLRLGALPALHLVDLDPKPLTKLRGYVRDDVSISRMFGRWAAQND
ncbi:Ipk1p [Malassezia vespertilionis]|uniref:Inositol-pentakisphosphate 2-kinase n=1 Tax=Malassezia vespertilionis TaxID=2020962 RepID=A0A2N1JAH4_9BASI|nr:Ipk1p [Malassezia vespertilionis]